MMPQEASNVLVCGIYRRISGWLNHPSQSSPGLIGLVRGDVNERGCACCNGKICAVAVQLKLAGIIDKGTGKLVNSGLIERSPLQECISLSESTMPSIMALSARIVSSFASNNRLAPNELPALIASVRDALNGATGPAPTAPQEPAVPLRKLVTADAVFCAECGAKFKSLKRHLGTEHDLTPHAYIQKWGLKGDHPMVAPNYSATRSALAKSMGLGSGGRAASSSKARKAPSKSTGAKPGRKPKATTSAD